MADAKSVIEAKLAVLRPVHQQHVANANAVSGAIQVLEEVLKEIAAAEAEVVTHG